MADKKKESNLKNSQNVSYEAKDIYVLEGLEPVRKRPGMYIGSTGVSGLHHLVWEVIDNSLDEAMAGFCQNITIKILEGEKISVADDGRGIPVDIHPQTKKSALETVLCTLHAGGKFGGESYKVAGGLHGVGVSVVNALSTNLRAEVCRQGSLYFQEYKYGKPVNKVKKAGSCHQTGTTISFEPDPQIFSEINFDFKTIIDHLREQAYLTPNVVIRAYDERKEANCPSYTFHFEGGITTYVKYLTRNDVIVQKNVFYVNQELDDYQVEVALRYIQDIETLELSFANNIRTIEGGMHLTGFRSALTRTLNDYARSEGLIKEDSLSLTGDDVREGLVSIVSVKLREPQFEGQTKAKLGNPEARTKVEQVVAESFKEFLEKNKEDAKHIIEKGLLSARARKAAKTARENVLRKGALEGSALPGKLADCISRKSEESELFIVEGESAGGCFSGDTKIALTDGRNITFKELVAEHEEGKKNYCYTIKEDGNIGVGLIENPRITKKVAPVIKVVLDNNEEIICTPDHLFMQKEGEYKQAKDLETSDLLNGYKLEESVIHYNHKIIKILPLEEKIDVYDLEVSGTHNFALAAGIFVHNSAKQGRDRQFQAILPLRGKILNIEKARMDRMMASEAIRDLIVALGVALSSDESGLAKLRYGKIIIMADADSDGAHIRTLLLTLFYRYYQALVEAGHIFIAQPPLYRIQKGKEVHFVYTEQEKEIILKKITGKSVKEETPKDVKKLKLQMESDGDAEFGIEQEKPQTEETDLKGIGIQRYKGLGEMNAIQLWDTTMDPQNRVLKQIQVVDAQEADHLFDVLMGDEVLPRKKFIEAYASKVKNLDV